MKGYNCVTFDLPKGRYHASDKITVCKLYNTIVCRVIECDDGTKSIYLNHGGWVTMSTAKAINKALCEAGIGARVFRKKNKLFFNFNGVVHEITNSGFLGVY